jgi:hypothetical protein
MGNMKRFCLSGKYSVAIKPEHTAVAGNIPEIVRKSNAGTLAEPMK